MSGLRKGPTTDVGVARRSHQGRRDCWWAFESVFGWQGRLANRPYGGCWWLFGWQAPPVPGHPLRARFARPRPLALERRGGEGGGCLSPCLAGKPRPAPASPAHVASLVRAPFPLRRGRFANRPYDAGRQGMCCYDRRRPGVRSMARRIRGVPPRALTITVISLPIRAERVPPKVQPRGNRPIPME